MDEVCPPEMDVNIEASVHSPPELPTPLLACCKRAGRHQTWHPRSRSRLLRVKSGALVPERRSGVHLYGRLFWVSDSLTRWVWLDFLIDGSDDTANQRWWWRWRLWWLRRRSSSTQTLALVGPNPKPTPPSSTIGFESSVWMVHITFMC